MRWLPLALLAGLAFMAGGCAHAGSATNQAGAGGAAKTAAQPVGNNGPSTSPVVGEIETSNAADAFAVIHVPGPMLPSGMTLVARDPKDPKLKPTAIMETTEIKSGHHQGVKLLYGVPTVGNEVVQPGPEYNALLELNLNPPAAATPPAAAPATAPAAP